MPHRSRTAGEGGRFPSLASCKRDPVRTGRILGRLSMIEALKRGCRDEDVFFVVHPVAEESVKQELGRCVNQAELNWFKQAVDRPVGGRRVVECERRIYKRDSCLYVAAPLDPIDAEPPLLEHLNQLPAAEDVAMMGLMQPAGAVQGVLQMKVIRIRRAYGEFPSRAANQRGDLVQEPDGVRAVLNDVLIGHQVEFLPAYGSIGELADERVVTRDLGVTLLADKTQEVSIAAAEIQHRVMAQEPATHQLAEPGREQ